MELIRGATAEPGTRLDLRNHRVMISTTVIAGPELRPMKRFFPARFVYATAHDRRNSLCATELKNAQAAEMPVSLGEVRRLVEREFNENHWRRSERHTPPRGGLCGIPLSGGIRMEITGCRGATAARIATSYRSLPVAAWNLVAPLCSAPSSRVSRGWRCAGRSLLKLGHDQTGARHTTSPGRSAPTVEAARR